MTLGRIVSSQSSRVRQKLVFCLAAWGALLFAPIVSWGSEIVVFGDSLSDVGNAYAATGGKVPPPPYYAGRFSNGPLWVEQLAPKLNAPIPTPSSQGGTDYAYAGAATGATPLGTKLGTPTGFSPFMTSDGKFIANVPSLPTQVASYIAGLHGGMPAAHTLAIVWAGANDFFDGQRDPTIPAKNIAAAVSTLIRAGVRNFLIPNLPDLSKTPYGLSSPMSTQLGLHALSVGFDKALSADLGSLTSAAGVHIHTLDTYGLFQKIQASPAQFHLSNVTQEGILTGNPSAPGYLFWDGVHPTTAGHQILATAAAAATPEPSSLTLLVIGLLALLGFRWRNVRGRLRRPVGRPVLCAEVALRSWLVLLCLCFVLLNPPNLRAEDPPAPRITSGVAQMEGKTVLEQSPPAGVASPSSPWPRGLLSPPVAVPGEHPLLGPERPSAYSNGGPMFDLDVMLGMLMGIRAQAAVYRSPYVAVVAEGFYGAILDELGTGEGAGAAGRVYFHRTDRAGYNTILIGPGVGAYCHFHHDIWMVAPTVDVSWVRPIGDLASWELGLNAGAGVGVAAGSDSSRVGRATPLISVFMGFRF